MNRSPDVEALADVIGPKFAEGAAERDETGTFVAEHYDLLKQQRIFSALVPTDLGGGGASYSAICAFLRRLAHYCPSTALAVSMHQHVVAAAIHHHRHGRPGQKLLRKVTVNEAVLVSTGANDWLESSGSAQRVAEGFRVNARKSFSSGSPKGDVLVTSVRHESAEEGVEVLHFSVPFSAPGVSLTLDWQTLGMRASGSNTITLANVLVPEDAIVFRRPAGKFHPIWQVIIMVACPLIMSVYAGVAEAASEIAGEQANKRRRDSTIPYLLGELHNCLTTVQLAVDDMLRLANNLEFATGDELTSAMLVRKTIVAEHVLATAEKALEVAGGSGFYRRLGLERFLRDAHAAQFHPLPAKRQHRFTGRVALGLDPISDGV